MRCETNSGTARATAWATAWGTAWVRAAIGSALGVLAIAGQALAQTPSIEFIEPSEGFTRTNVTGISDFGTVVGYSFNLSNSALGPVFRYTPGGARTEYGVGYGAVISGDGRVISIGTSGGLAPPRLYYDDGTTRDLPNLTLAGQERQGFVTHLNHDGSVAMLAASYDRPGEGRQTSYRWTESGGAQIPPFPGGSSWNHANGMSSDGSIVVGDWASNSTMISGPWAWDATQPTLTSLVTQSGQPIVLGSATTITGDGRTIYASGFAIHDGVAVGWTDGAPFTGIFPSGASYDGSVLVGSLGLSGSWIWTQETGAMRANEFLRLHGVDVPLDRNLGSLKVSGDGLHFGGLIGFEDIGTRGFVATIPSPNVLMPVSITALLATRRSRRHRNPVCHRRRAGFFVALAWSAGILGAAHAQTPAFEYIPPTPGFTQSYLFDLADDGTAIGMSFNGSGPDLAPIIRYAPGGSITTYPVGADARISGDGQVVAIKTVGASTGATATLHYMDGSQRILPGIVYQGQLRTGVVSHLNFDGSVAMLGVGSSTGGGFTDGSAYRWTLESNTTSYPPFPGGSTWNSTTGLSSDGRIAVGDWAPNSTQNNRPWVWEDVGPTLTPLTDPSGAPIIFGGVGTISGDGHSIYANGFVIHDGVATPWDSGSSFVGIFPNDASYDGSVLVGRLGTPDGLGSWIWTQETGAMRAADFFRHHGVALSDGVLGSNIIVSSDGRHFAGFVRNSVDGFMAAVVTIPAPGVVGSFVFVGTIATARRRRDSR